MKKCKSLKALSIFLLSSSLCNVIKADIMDDFFAEMKTFEQEFKKVRKEMQARSNAVAQQFNNWQTSFSQPTYEIKKDDEQVSIILNAITIDPDTIDSHLEDNKMIVMIPQNNREIEITISENMLSLSSRFKQEQKKQTQDEKDKENKQELSYVYANSQNIQSLPAKVNIHEVSIEYSTDNETLTIMLPTISSKKIIKKIDIIKK